MRIERLYRYPVKGLTPEALDAASVEPGGTLPWDRAFALAQGDAPFDPAAPRWLKKTWFMCLMVNARIAALRSSFDESSGRLTIAAPDGEAITAPALTEAGRARIAAWLSAFLGDDARGSPIFHYVPGHSFSDQSRKVVSLINLASLGDLERRVGSRRHKRRFRANVYFSGAAAWSEHDWIGRQIMVGGARLRVFRRINRCPATEVNPETAERDADPVAELRAAFGHSDLGIHAIVEDGGEIEVGAAMALLPD
ncbi:MAG TPA: MOSC N-terminal beta barrel domain-containing protein [Acetobacteraceae bacterium]|jgi:hypothetical protein|nr:MOSC N-terminal beta barrel domain-containing protein [Acetobacteraceae bacterium]